MENSLCQSFSSSSSEKSCKNGEKMIPSHISQQAVCSKTHRSVKGLLMMSQGALVLLLGQCLRD